MLAATCHLLNILNLEKVGPDMDPNCLPLCVVLKEFFEKVGFRKSQQMTTEE